MTLADDLKPLLAEIRSIPGQLGLRPRTVSVVLKSYSGAVTGEGLDLETVTAITEANGQPPKVRLLDDEELAVGALSKGTIEVGPMTTDFTGGGTSIATLTQPDADNGDVRLFRVTGPQGTTDYALDSVTDDRALHYTIRLKPVEAQ